MKRLSSILLASILGSALATSAALADAPSPKEAYLKYRAALSAATKIDDLQSLMCKKVNEEIAGTPADMKPMMFGLIKDTTPKDVQVLSEKIEGKTATLTLTGKTAPDSPDTKESTTGKVTLVNEGGSWKIDKEEWKSKIEVGGHEEAATK